MNLFILYGTAALMALVGAACAVLCVAWTIPSWRRRLVKPQVVPQVPGQSESGALTGWSARIGSVLISTGIAICAVAGGYGCYCVLAALSFGTW